MKKDPIVYQYTEPKSPLPAEGVQPRVLFHTGEGHDEDECVYDCIQCGKNIAGELQQLNVGGADRASTSPRALQYRDVFLLTYYGNLHDTQTDDSGNVTEEASGLIRGLREAGIPVTILVEEDHTMLKEVATMEGPNDVFAAQSTEVQGLERKIVVFAQADGLNSENEDRGRLQAMSRCTAQLIWVKPPLPPPDKISH
ncbi:hypothetical protein V1264_010253 [Littorina saxatilis]|uniref:Uncharacterized protein n=2 Tax=Littorina saxatilis TaxID=31220 RepID=A0AAN9API6_9CAEN